VSTSEREPPKLEGGEDLDWIEDEAGQVCRMRLPWEMVSWAEGTEQQGEERPGEDGAPPEDAPPAPIATLRGKGAIVETYNRLGSTMTRVASVHGLDMAAVLAVWKVETGPYRHVPGKAIIRFENHLLWGAWGKTATRIYDAHFRHGGHAGVEGKPWHNHAYRADAQGAWRDLHRGQDREYDALAVAIRLAGEATALGCISIGGPQILIRNHALLGYATRKDMYTAFQASEESHVLGFFAFCEKKGIMGALRSKDWEAFARVYNGSGQVPLYKKKLEAAYAEASQALALGGG
jgi:hypothetical protein